VPSKREKGYTQMGKMLCHSIVRNSGRGERNQPVAGVVGGRRRGVTYRRSPGLAAARRTPEGLAEACSFPDRRPAGALVRPATGGRSARSRAGPLASPTRFLPPRQPLLERCLTFGRRLPCEQIGHANVLIDGRPMNAPAAADQAPRVSLVHACM